jgi:hypothetical protein
MNQRALEPSALAMLKWMHGAQAEFEHFAPGIKAGLLEQAQECITAYEAHLKAGGFVVVPVEATTQQMDAAGKAVTQYIENMTCAGGEVEATDYALRAVIYTAMISPAQEPNDASD